MGVYGFFFIDYASNLNPPVHIVKFENIYHINIKVYKLIITVAHTVYSEWISFWLAKIINIEAHEKKNVDILRTFWCEHKNKLFFPGKKLEKKNDFNYIKMYLSRNIFLKLLF